MDSNESADALSRAARSSVSRDVVLTAITSGLLLVGNVVTLALLARRGADTVFAPYSLARRLAVGLQPALCLGMNIGLVRFLPGGDGPYRRRLSRNAVMLFGGVLLLATGAAALIRPVVASWMPLLESTSTYWAAWLNIVATAVVAMTYALFRAEMRQGRANTLNLLSVMFVPLLVVMFAPKSWGIDALLAWAGAGTLVTAIGVSWKHLVGLWSGDDCPIDLPKWHAESRVLLEFSTGRVPAAVSVGLMTVVGPWLAASGDEVRDASYLLAGFAFAQGLSTALGALGLVLMPRVAGYTSSGLDERSASLVEKGLFASMLVAVISTPLLIAESGPLVHWWLGSDLAAGVRVVQIVLLGVPGVLAYSLLGPVSDASASRPVTTWAASVGLLACAVGSLAWRSTPAGMAAAFAVGQTLAAGIVLVSVLKRFVVPMHLGNLACWAGASVGAGVVLHNVAGAGSWNSLLELAMAVTAGSVLVGLAIRLSPERLGLWTTASAIVQRNGRRPRGSAWRRPDEH